MEIIHIPIKREIAYFTCLLIFHTIFNPVHVIMPFDGCLLSKEPMREKAK